jgi:hypothetical protein
MPNKISQCHSCKKDIIWLKTFKGKNIPVDAETVKDPEAKLFDRATMVCHFETCVDAEKFRKPKEEKTAPAKTETPPPAAEPEEEIPL